MNAKVDKIESGKSQILEHGNIYFFYRPRVEANEEKIIKFMV